ncbi:DUF4296 domain-containing protein [Flavobacterium nackdongense]|uniref:DUF4296 domain-containing protein n=1 Tax=Flavobacterium nackdongense TaxID=2547394 RepID=A0A4P6YF97_9FLAO|nr:DUF4296 domain-containing protein [Flavobacterium nackdongense]QBN19564.1 DUF4296 domain-containing protein [Flavobacterium nackdongense]
MKKIVPFFILLILLIGCEKELVKEPKNLIPKEKMVDIMYDLSLLDGMKVQDPTLVDSLKISTNQYLYKKYKIDSVQFAQSNIYYAADYKAYEKMYNQVKARIDKNKLEITALVKAKAKKDSLAAVRKKKLQLKKEADSIKKAKKDLKVKKEVDSLKKSKTSQSSKAKDSQTKTAK